MSKSVVEAVKVLGNNSESLLKILQYVNKTDGYVSKESMRDIAELLDIAAAKVYSVASFYHYIHLQPMGKHVIYLCKTISCQMKSRGAVVKGIQELLKIDFGEMTEDKLFSLVEVSCLGQCDKAPAMMIDDTPFGNLTTDKVKYILEDYIHHGGVNAIKEEACYE